MYGLQDASGGRNSSRFDFGFEEYIGMRTAAERFRREYARLTGASKPGTSRLYEFVEGAAKPRIAGACFKSPPAYHSAVWLRSAYLSPPKSGLPFFQSDWWVCIPEPLSLKTGLGMNVAVLPALLATFRTMYLYFIILSAALIRVSNRKSISHWPAVATSW